MSLENMPPVQHGKRLWQTQKVSQTELSIASELERQMQAKAIKAPKVFSFDFFLVKETWLYRFCEAKTRSCDSLKYPTVIFDKTKFTLWDHWNEKILYSSQEPDVPLTLAVMFTDGLFVCRASRNWKDDYRQELFRSPNNEQEPDSSCYVVHVPKENFTKISEPLLS